MCILQTKTELPDASKQLVKQIVRQIVFKLINTNAVKILLQWKNEEFFFKKKFIWDIFMPPLSRDTIDG